MRVDVLVAEIGSTTTLVSAFYGVESNDPRFLGQGQALTSVAQGDVNTGLSAAIADLKQRLGISELSWDRFFATSSAAGGLRMSVHGLVYDMTVRAAKEAALGAGAIVKFITAGKLREDELAQVGEINPNIMLVAGGVDYGEAETAYHNFERLSETYPDIPIIYAGNIANRYRIQSAAEALGIQVYFAENVFPQVDTLNVGPARKIIQQAFEKHIVTAPGMENIRALVGGPILPTPGAVMESALILYEMIGDLIVFDVGGATTDLHSVTEGSEEIKALMTDPEPVAKRTVEGDLGVYINMPNIAERIGMDKLIKDFPDTERYIAEPRVIPQTPGEERFIERLTLEAVQAALSRHAGTLRDIYGPSGKRTIASGKDLSAVKYIIGTGGALTRLPGNHEILGSVITDRKGLDLYPKPGARVLIDSLYIMAPLGALAKEYKNAAAILLKKSLNI